jgi:fructokinase
MIDSFDEKLVAGANVLHVGSSTLSREPSRAATLRALAVAKEAGALISTDPNWRPHLWDDQSEARPMLERLLALADVVKVSDDELAAMVGTSDVEEGAQRIRRLGPRLVIVTLGASGCFFEADSGRGHVPGEKVQVVDSTGAGDGFVAGLWAHLLDEDSWSREVIERACAFGNYVGAQVVTALGATTALPRLTAAERRRK